MNKADSVSSTQLFYIITGAQIGIGIFALPRLVSAHAHQDAWIAVLIGALLPLLSLFIIVNLGRRMPGSNFVAMNQQLFGRWLGTIMIFIFIIYIVFFESTVIRIFSEITSIYLLPRTPLTVIIFTVVLTAVYIMNKGAQVVARLNAIFFWIMIPLVFLGLSALVHADYTNLLPVGEANFKALARSALSSATSYAGIEVLLVFYFFVQQKERILKVGLLGLGWTLSLYLLVTVTCLLIFGADFMQMNNWPVLTSFKTISFSLFERPEIIALSLWLLVGIRPIMNLGFAAVYSLNEVLQINREKYFSWAVIAVALPMFILALCPQNLIIALKWSEYAGYLFLLGGLFYPLLMLAVALIRKKEIDHAG